MYSRPEILRYLKNLTLIQQNIALLKRQETKGQSKKPAHLIEKPMREATFHKAREGTINWNNLTLTDSSKFPIRTGTRESPFT